MARDFDGSDDKIVIGDIAIDGLTTLGMSVWFVTDVTTAGQYQTMFSKMVDDFNSRVEVSMGPGTGTIQVAIGNGSSASVGYMGAGDVTLLVGTLYHLFWYFDGAETGNVARLKIWIDGAQQTGMGFGGTIPATLPTMSESAHIGARFDSPGDLFWDGRLSEFAMWTGPPGGMLPAAAAAILAKGYSPNILRRNGLHYYPLIGKHSPEIDLWGGNSGTLTGTTASAHPRIIQPKRRRVSRAAMVVPPEILFAQACL